MAQYKSEYSKPSVGGSACAYTQLGCYLGSNPTMPPVNPGTTQGMYVVPNYSAIGYDALTHGNNGSSCGSYFNINDAYGTNFNTGFSTRLCDSGCGGGGRKPGGGIAWRCAPNHPEGAQCIQVHPGTPGGPTYRHKKQCEQAGCENIGNVWACAPNNPGGAKCIPVPTSSKDIPTPNYPTYKDCQAQSNCAGNNPKPSSSGTWGCANPSPNNTGPECLDSSKYPKNTQYENPPIYKDFNDCMQNTKIC